MIQQAENVENNSEMAEEQRTCYILNTSCFW